jgi:hypothetical protein
MVAATATVTDACGLTVTDSDVWVTSPGSAQLTALSIDLSATRLQIDLPGKMPFVIVANGDQLWVSGEGGGGWMAIVDAASGQVLHDLAAPDVPFFDSFAFCADSAWGVGRMSSTLHQLDAATGAVLGTLEIGAEPSGVVCVEDVVYVTQLGGMLTRVDPSTMTVTGTWQLPYTWLVAGPYAFGSLWAASLEENALVRIDVARLPA